MKRYVLREWNENDPNPGWITEAELKQRFIMAVNAHLAYNDWPNTLRILLHGQGEQAEPCYICKRTDGKHEPFCSRSPQPPDDEWERLVERMPELDWSNQDKFKQWFREMGEIIRQILRGK